MTFSFEVFSGCLIVLAGMRGNRVRGHPAGRTRNNPTPTLLQLGRHAYMVAASITILRLILWLQYSCNHGTMSPVVAARQVVQPICLGSTSSRVCRCGPATLDSLQGLSTSDSSTQGIFRFRCPMYIDTGTEALYYLSECMNPMIVMKNSCQLNI